MSISVHRTSRSTLIGIAIVLGVIVVAFIAAELLYATVPPGPALPQGHLTDAQSKALDVMLKLCDSFITWGVATIGGVALLLRFSIEKKLPGNPNSGLAIGQYVGVPISVAAAVTYLSNLSSLQKWAATAAVLLIPGIHSLAPKFIFTRNEAKKTTRYVKVVVTVRIQRSPQRRRTLLIAQPARA